MLSNRSFTRSTPKKLCKARFDVTPNPPAVPNEKVRAFGKNWEKSLVYSDWATSNPTAVTGAVRETND
jgi:hypothetical protein